MIKHVSRLFFLWIMLSNIAWAFTAAPGVNTATHNFLGPTANVRVSYPAGYNVSSSLSFEGGPRQYRGSATLGWMLSDNHRIKFTGEYLWQKIDYNFYSGTVRQWVNQGAVGVGYQYLLFDGVMNDVRLDGYYSHAPTKGLSTVSGSFVSSGTAYTYVDERRIAGSNAAGLSPGFALHPWYGAEAVLSANYDNVHYDTHYLPARHYSGLGGTIDFKQALPANLQLALLASSRTAFNNYQAGLNWNKTVESGLLTLGILGSYNKGKHTLPDTSVISFNLGYTFDQSISLDDDDRDYQLPTSLSNWVAQPAVHMPQVLAIADEQVTLSSSSACTPPTFSGPIPNPPDDDPFSPFFFATAAFFSGSNLVFSADNLPSTITINPATGELSGTYPFTSVTPVTVTATNECGSVTSNTFNIIAG